MIIPGEKALSTDIDGYLQPLIKELVQLWHGADVYYAYTNTRFTLVGAFHSTANDFPAYANLYWGALHSITNYLGIWLDAFLGMLICISKYFS